MITGHTRIAAVIGWPVEHSLSPAIHNAWFQETGSDWTYVAFPVESLHLKDAINGVRALGIGGLSVTMPHKEDIIQHLDAVDHIATALRAVNCVAVRDGELTGTNTDGDGCCDAIEQRGATSVQGKNVALLGAGGTARAIAAAMMRRGAHVRVVNRSVNRAHELVDMCHSAVSGHSSDAVGTGSVSVGTVGDIASCEIVVNATSVGMNTSEHPCDIALVNTSAIVMDAVYSPLRTSWLEAVAAKGSTTVDGLWMLIYQAMRQQQWWFGVNPDPHVMRSAAERELAHRRQ
jgi:shikimate dehydrogenase